MDINDVKGGSTFVIGLHFCFPPRYAAFKETEPSGWMWTSDLAEAKSFPTKEAAERCLKGDLAGLVDGNEDVKVLQVDVKLTYE